MSRHRLEPTRVLFSPAGILRDIIIAGLLFIIAWRCVPDVLWMRLVVVLVGLPVLVIVDYMLRYYELSRMKGK